MSAALEMLVDANHARRAAQMTIGATAPQYPVIVLGTATTMLLVAAPYLLRPARRTVLALLGFAALCAVVALVGMPDDVIASVAIGCGLAALLHLSAGTPAATPSREQVARALSDLGVTVTGARARR